MYRTIAFIACSVVASFVANPASGQFAYPDFSSVDGIVFMDAPWDSAFQNGSAIRLNPSVASTEGGIYFDEKQKVDLGFHTRFEFSISEIAGSGSDTINFIVIGGPEGTPFSHPHVDVEIDTFQNPWDANANHVSVFDVPGDPSSTIELTATPLPFNASDGAIHAVDIVYDGIGHQLSVTFDDAIAPLVTVGVDIAASVALENGKSWVELFARTGSAPEAHDVHSWTFTPVPEPSCFFLAAIGFVGIVLWRRGSGKRKRNSLNPAL